MFLITQREIGFEGGDPAETWGEVQIADLSGTENFRVYDARDGNSCPSALD